MSFKEFLNELKEEKRVEGELIKTVFYSLLVSFGMLGVLYYFKFRFIEDFIPTYGFYLFFAALSYSFIIATVRQVRAYREMPCMSGMMVGMTTGMIAGFLPGFFIASTNGMFVGSIFGMLIGISLGVYNGKCCGIMGTMEGIMAGFMGGLMGAMTSFMLFNDNLKPATVIVFLVSAIIVFGLNYMIYKEMKREKRQMVEDHFFTLILTLLLIAATIWVMMFGPRTGIFG